MRTEFLSCDGDIISINGTSVDYSGYLYPHMNEINRRMLIGDYKAFYGTVKYCLKMQNLYCTQNSFSVLNAGKKIGINLADAGLEMFIGYYYLKGESSMFSLHVWFANTLGEVIDTWVPKGTEISYVGTNVLNIINRPQMNYPHLTNFFEEMSCLQTMQHILDGKYKRVTALFKILKKQLQH